jgi:hypothetical protein
MSWSEVGLASRLATPAENVTGMGVTARTPSRISSSEFGSGTALLTKLDTDKEGCAAKCRWRNPGRRAHAFLLPPLAMTSPQVN